MNANVRRWPQIRLVVLLMIACCALPALTSAAEALQTGKAFQKELEGLTTVFWKDQQTLRGAVTNLAAAKNVAILLDRRVDPDQRVELTLSDAPLEELLRRLAQRQKLGISFFDSTIYLGPETVTYRLATVAAVQHDRAMQSGNERRAKLQSLPPLQTAALASPRELLEAWSAQCGVQIEGLEQVPHDLWPALHYPAQTAATRASLILAGFELAIEFNADATVARIVPMPEKPVLERRYAGGSNPRERAKQITERFPLVEVKVEGTQLVVSGSFEDHDLIRRLLAGEKIRRTNVGPPTKQYTLEVTNQPLGAVAKAIGEQAGMTVEFDPALKDELNQRISLKVKDATLEELFTALVKPARLDFELIEKGVRIVPKK